MMYLDLHVRLDKLFNDCGFENLNDKNCLSFEKHVYSLNCNKYYIILHDLHKFSPVYINDLLKEYHGYDKNFLEGNDYSYYISTSHPSTYGNLVESVLHFKEEGSNFLNLIYKLRNTKNKFEKFITSSKSIYLNGKVLYAITVMKKFTEAFDPALTFDQQDLSSREKEIIVVYCEGKNVKEVAEFLCISPHTVKVHLRNIYKKLGISNIRALFPIYKKL